MAWLSCATSCAITDHWIKLRTEVLPETRYLYKSYGGVLWWYKTRKTTVSEYAHGALTLAAAEAMADALTTHPGARSWITSGTFVTARSERVDGEMYRVLKTEIVKEPWAGTGAPPSDAGGLDGWTAVNLDQ